MHDDLKQRLRDEVDAELGNKGRPGERYDIVDGEVTFAATYPSAVSASGASGSWPTHCRVGTGCEAEKEWMGWGKHNGRAIASFLLALSVLIPLAGCAQTSDEKETAGSNGSSDTPVAPPSPTEALIDFPIDAFAHISEDRVSDERAEQFQAALREMAGNGGMTATVISPEGTWSGVTGKADGVRDVRVDDQFAIASVTKSVIAAQVMQMVEAGELALDDPASEYLPPALDSDTNEATIRELLSHRSGIPDYWYLPEVQEGLRTDRQRRWKPTELLELVPNDRAPVGSAFEYADTNYVLLGLVIEQVRGRPVAEVLREGVLNIEGVDRLIYQPDEKPTSPMAMPNGESTAALKKGGGYLPSLAGSTSESAAAAMASDAPSLARWWRAFCAGEIVSQASVSEMTTFDDGDGYGLGVFSLYGGAIGHGGEHFGFAAWTGCLPEHGSVVVVLANRVPEYVLGMGTPLVDAVASANAE